MPITATARAAHDLLDAIGAHAAFESRVARADHAIREAMSHHGLMVLTRTGAVERTADDVMRTITALPLYLMSQRDESFDALITSITDDLQLPVQLDFSHAPALTALPTTPEINHLMRVYGAVYKCVHDITEKGITTINGQRVTAMSIEQMVIDFYSLPDKKVIAMLKQIHREATGTDWNSRA